MPLKKTDFEDYPMTVHEVVAYTGYGRELIYLESRTGNLRFINRGGRGDRRWRKSDVDAWLETGMSDA